MRLNCAAAVAPRVMRSAKLSDFQILTGGSSGPQSLETLGKANPNVAMQAVTFIIKTTF
jgi:hypothetical protein